MVRYGEEMDIPIATVNEWSIQKIIADTAQKTFNADDIKIFCQFLLHRTLIV